MLILLVNDDGIHAPGLRALRRELSALGDVRVVAPAAEQSGVGLSITYLHPLLVDDVFEDGERFGWAVHGSPADCVKLGVLRFCEHTPDLVVSGINAGSNAGINVLYSGTVAGAIEGAFFGITSVAVSLSHDAPPDYDDTARRATVVLQRLLATNPEPGSLWNVNFPPSFAEGPRGVRFTSLGVKRHVDVMERRTDPRGKPYYWSGLDPIENHQMEPGSDIRELADGYVTVTPLDLDLTHHARLRAFTERTRFDESPP